MSCFSARRSAKTASPCRYHASMPINMFGAVTKPMCSL